VVGVGVSFAAGTPHPSLRGVVLRYQGYAQRSPGPVSFRELPCTFVPIIIDLDAGWTVAHREHVGGSPLRLGSFVAGITDGPVLVGHGGSARCLQVDLTALGARRLIGMPMSELANPGRYPSRTCSAGRARRWCSGWVTRRTGHRGSHCWTARFGCGSPNPETSTPVSRGRCGGSPPPVARR
jgi:hypothetical protein